MVHQELPQGVRITVGGTVETSAESQQPIAAVVPVMLLVMALLWAAGALLQRR